VAHPLTLPVYLPALVISISEGLLIPVLPLFVRELDASYALVGLALAGEGLGMLLGDVPAGVLLRQLGRKGTMLLGLSSAMLSTVALFWVGSLSLAFMCRLITGFGHALWNVSRHAYVADVVQVSSRGRALAFLGGLFRIGHLLGPIAGGILAATYGLRAMFPAFGAVYAIALLMVLVFVRSTRSMQPEGAARPAIYDSHLLSTLKAHYRVLASAGAGQLFAQAIRAGRDVIIPLYAADVLGLDVRSIGLIVGIGMAAEVALFYPAGWIMDRWGRKYAIVPCFAIQALGMLFVPLAAGLVGLAVAAVVIGLGNGLGSGSMMVLGADLAPQETRGEFLGLWRLIGDAGSSGGPLVVGNVANLIALPVAAWVMCAVGLTAAVIFGLLVPETLTTRRVPGAR
jgi:MFS family permease